MSAPPVSPIPTHVALGGTLLIASAYPDAAAICRAAGAVCVAVEHRTSRVHLVPDEGTWHTLKGHCDFYGVPAVTAARYQRTTE